MAESQANIGAQITELKILIEQKQACLIHSAQCSAEQKANKEARREEKNATQVELMKDIESLMHQQDVLKEITRKSVLQKRRTLP